MADWLGGAYENKWWLNRNGSASTAFRYLWNIGTGSGNPTSGNLKIRTSTTPDQVRIAHFDSDGNDISAELLNIVIGKRIIIKSAVSANYAIFNVTADAVDVIVAPPDEDQSNVEIGYTLSAGSITGTWTNFEPCYMSIDSGSGSGSGVTSAELQAIQNFAYFDADFNLYDLANGVIRSGTQVAATVSALPAAASNIGNMYLVTEVGTHGTLYFASNKTGTAEWLPLNGIATIYALGSPINAIAPASTFTSVTATSANSGTDIQLASAGVHGLTTSPAVGCKIYVSAGTNWTAGFYTIKSITNTTTLVLEEPWVASMGTPTIVLADNSTEMPVIAVSIPPMLERSTLKIELAGELTASTNGKKTIIDFGSMRCYNKNNNGSEGIESTIVRISNQGSKTAQKTHYTLGNNTGYGSTAGVAVTGTENTANAVTLYLRYIFQTANEVHSINSLDVIRVD